MPYIILNVLLIVGLQLYHPLLYKQSYSESPSFVRQEIKDAKEDWQLWNGALHSFNVTTHDGKLVTIDMANKTSDCKINGQFISPDIESVSYKSDGKTLDGTIWLTAPFIEPPINDTIDTYQEELRIEEQNQNLSLENYMLVKKGQIGASDLKIENLTLSGIPAHRVAYNDIVGNQKIVRLDVWAVHNNKAYDFMFTSLESKYQRYYPIFENIINSLRIKDLGSDVFGINQSMQGMKTYEDSDIKINYPSEWQALKSHNKEGQSIIFRSPFEDSQSKEPSWHETTFTMAVDLDSVYDAGTDYRIIYTRIPHGEWTGNWTTQVEEVSAYDRVGYVEEKTNSSLFDVRTPYRIPFSFNLDEANSPEHYKDVFYITDHYVLGHHFCRLVDTTNWVIVPPPNFVISTSPSSLVLRPGEESNILIKIEGKPNVQSQASLSIDNSRKDLLATFVPDRTSLTSSSGTSSLHIKVLDNSSVGT
ncbi:MAG: hypothetical protein ACRD93_07870, partial [Nitrososphaeraceae archaeon]